MRKYSKGYKVCRNVGGLTSAYPSLGQGVDYKIGKWTKRPVGCGPLAVFDSEENAERFLLRVIQRNRFTIFKCKYEKSNDDYLWFFTNGMKKQDHCLPRGTLFAEKIKLKRL